MKDLQPCFVDKEAQHQRPSFTVSEKKRAQRWLGSEPASALSRCKILAKLFNRSVPQFPICKLGKMTSGHNHLPIILKSLKIKMVL